MLHRSLSFVRLSVLQLAVPFSPFEPQCFCLIGTGTRVLGVEARGVVEAVALQSIFSLAEVQVVNGLRAGANIDGRFCIAISQSTAHLP